MLVRDLVPTVALLPPTATPETRSRFDPVRVAFLNPLVDEVIVCCPGSSEAMPLPPEAGDRFGLVSGDSMNVNVYTPEDETFKS
jgi:hypothetical protein